MGKNLEYSTLQGLIINYSIKVEYLINEVLVSYFKPHNNVLFLSHVLNSSVMHYGGKLKVLNAIGLEKKDYEKLQRLGAIRNSFAHSNDSLNVAYFFSEKKDSCPKKHLSVMNSRGELKYKDINKLHEEFLKIFTDIEVVLKELKQSLIT